MSIGAMVHLMNEKVCDESVECPLCRGAGVVRVARQQKFYVGIDMANYPDRSTIGGKPIAGRRCSMLVVDDILDASANFPSRRELKKSLRWYTDTITPAFNASASRPYRECQCPLCAGWTRVPPALAAAYALLKDRGDMRTIEDLREADLLPEEPPRCFSKNIKRTTRKTPGKRLRFWNSNGS